MLRFEIPSSADNNNDGSTNSLFPAYEIGVGDTSISYVVENTLCVKRRLYHDSWSAATHRSIVKLQITISKRLK
jgi:hypothetical protein